MNRLLITLLFLSSVAFSQMMGGWSNQPLNSSSLDKLTQFLLTNISSPSSSLKPEKWTLDEVYLYQTQVVAGINHKLVAQISNSISSFKKTIHAVIFQSLNQEFNLFKLFDIVNSNQNNMQLLSNSETLLDLKSKIVKIHEYYSQGKITFNVKKIRWAEYFSIQNGQENYYLNYELEGTNNEISLWEHWLRKVENKHALDASLFLIKLPLGKFDFKDFTMTNECEGIRSFLLCGLNSCDNKQFVTQGKCQKIEKNS